MDNDTPELIETVRTAKEVLIEDLSTLIEDNARRLKARVDAKGNPLTDAQADNLQNIIEAQMLRLAEMKNKNQKRKTKHS